MGVFHVRGIHYVTGNILNLKKNVTPDMNSSNLTDIQVYFGVIFLELVS